MTQTADLLARTRALTEAADRIGRTLLELDADPDWLLLEQATFSGETARRWAAARAAIGDLWSSYAQLRSVADRAASLAAGRLDAATIAGLEGLVDGPSVLVREERPGPVQRDLLQGTSLVERARPADLLARMSAQYDEVRRVVTAVTAAWAEARQRISTARTLLDEADRLAAGLDVPDHASVAAARQEVARLAVVAFEDPLALDRDELGAAEDAATAVVAELRAAGALRAGLDDALLQAAGRRDELARSRTRVGAARELTLAKVADPGAPPAEPDGTVEQAAWTELQEALTARRWVDAGHRLERWLTAADDLLAALDEQEAAWRHPLDERNELRARLEALRAVAAGRGAAEDEDLAAAYDTAWTCLHRVPCEVTAAHRLLGAYGAAVEALKRRGASDER